MWDFNPRYRLPIHHIGFVGLSESELREKIIRNFRLGLKKLYEYPNIGQSYQELGELILNYGDPKVAIRLFQRAVEISPGSVKSCLLLADSYLRIGLPRDAQHILLALRTRFPENLDIKERLGRIAYELGEFDAVELYLAGTERYFSLVYLALARLHQSKYHEAFRAAASAVKINPYGSEGRIVFLRLALKLSEEKKETVVERDNL